MSVLRTVAKVAQAAVVGVVASKVVAGMPRVVEVADVAAARAFRRASDGVGRLAAKVRERAK